MGASISVFLDTRIKKSDSVYPVKIRATYNRERIYLGIEKERINNKLNGSQLEIYRFDGKGNYSIDQETFNKAMEIETEDERVKREKQGKKKTKPTGKIKELQIVFRGVELDAQKIADSLNPFTFDAFKTRMSTRKSKENKVFTQFEELINELKATERIGTAISYNCASVSLKKFTGDKEVPFEYFTKSKLNQYKIWMQTGDNTCSDTTVGMYLRALRTLFNRVIGKTGITTYYPFGKSKESYSIPKGKGRKIALNKPELQKIFDFNLTQKHPYSFYLDMWKLMYLMGGPNPTDVCMLRESNIKNGFIYFFRQKTKRTSIDPKEIQVPYSDQVKEIIVRWQKPETKDPYLIPVVNDSMTAIQRKSVIKRFVKMVNTAMKHVGGKLEIDQKITSYVARHSIATQLLRSGASVKLIGDQLGHQDTKTTQGYLDGFEDEQIKEAFNLATKF
jgi:integrase/recombinase XerD